jgi:exopolyphosphatase / guanosine-5'-triphosphate,3'-diphosphate pyrophosphatase
LKLAAIDIGSNAARLLISDVIQGPLNKLIFIKVALVRVPLRLGFDVFDKEAISEIRREKFIKTIKSYKLLLDVYDVEHVKACATSAMRHATNSDEIIQTIKEETGIEIGILSGDQEASVIFDTHIAENLDPGESYLYIDVGGGSTEVIFFSDGKLIFKRSFEIGTIRLLRNQVDETKWTELKEFIKEKTKGHHHVTAIGSGGNINKVFSLSKRKEGKALSLDLLRDYYHEFSNLSLLERMSSYKLREDRADVIVSALLIFINIMKWADADKIYVPKIGLVDGLMRELYDSLAPDRNQMSRLLI